MYSARRSSLLLLCLLLGACSNSPVFINPLYNRLDDQIMTSFERLTEFDDAQTAEFEAIATNFHYWHRKSELPVYAALLEDVQKTIRSRKSTQREDVARWLKTSEGFTRSFRACHPINFSNGIIRSLTDEQLEAIKIKRNARQVEFRQKYYEEKPEARRKRRGDSIIKWISRIGLQLTEKTGRHAARYASQANQPAYRVFCAFKPTGTRASTNYSMSATRQISHRACRSTLTNSGTCLNAPTRKNGDRTVSSGQTLSTAWSSLSIPSKEPTLVAGSEKWAAH